MRLSRRQSIGVLVLAFSLLGLLVFGRAIWYGFVPLDDISLLFENPAMRGATPWHLWRMFSTYDPELYIPLTLVSFKLNELLLSPEPWSYHLMNLLLHIGNALLVVRVAWLLLRKPGVAVLAGLLFLLHPLSVETAVWISARKDSLMALFFLLSLCSYLRATSDRSSPGAVYTCTSTCIHPWGASGPRTSLLPSVIFHLLSLLSKVTGLILPFLFLLCDLLRRRQLSLRAHLQEKGIFLFFSGVFAVIALLGKDNVTSLSLFNRAVIALEAVAFHAWRIIYPARFSVYYPFEPASVTIPRALVLLGMAVAMIAVAWIFRRMRPLLSFAIAWYLVTLFPSLFNLAKGVDLYSGSDRYAYLPMMGVFIAVAAGAWWFRERAAHMGIHRFIVPAASTALLIVLTVASFRQTAIWESGQALLDRTLALHPRARVVYIILGGEARAAGEYEEALALYDKAMAIASDAQVFYEQAITYEKMGRFAEALAAYGNAIDATPRFAVARVNAGRLLYRGSEKEAALEQFTLAVEADPHLAMAHFNRGVILGEMGDAAGAEAAYLRALEADPLFQDAWRNLINLYVRLGRLEEARMAAGHGGMEEIAPEIP